MDVYIERDDFNDEEQSLNVERCKSWLYKNYFCVEAARRRFPIIQWLPGYQVDEIKGDLIAGFSVAFILIPQALGFALLANVPITHGLYSSIFASFVYTIFGSCKDFNIGPNSPLALLASSYVLIGGQNYASLLAFIQGILQIIAGLINFNFFVEIVSFPVISGFINSVVITIVLVQFSEIFGISKTFKSSRIAVILIYDIFANLDQMKAFDTLLGCISLLVIYIAIFTNKYLKTNNDRKIITNNVKDRLINKQDNNRHFNSFIYWLSLSRNLLVIILSTIAAYCLREYNLFTLNENITPGFPEFEAPYFTRNITIKKDGVVIQKILNFSEIFCQLTPGWFLIPFMSAILSLTMPKVLFQSSDNPVPKRLLKNTISVQNFDASQELLTIGIANLLGSFVQSFPIGFSVGRSLLARTSGVKTQLNTAFTGIVVVIALLPSVSPAIQYIPKATLSAVIISTLLSALKPKDFIHFYNTNRVDFMLNLITFFAILIFGIEVGFLSGLIINLMVLLAKIRRPQIETKVMCIGFKEGNEQFGLPFIIVKPTGNIHFPAIDYLATNVINSFPRLPRFENEEESIEDETKMVVVIDGEHIFQSDSTFIKGFKDFYLSLKAKEIKVIFHRIRLPIRKRLQFIFTESGLLFNYSKNEEDLYKCVKAAFKRPHLLGKYSTFIQTNI